MKRLCGGTYIPPVNALPPPRPSKNMKTDFVLDQWDSELIMCLKRGNGYDIDACETIWCKRCALPDDYHCLPYIVERMCKIVERLGLAHISDLMIAVSPDSQWKYGLGEQPNLSHTECWFYALASILANTKIVDLPGLKI